MQNPPANTPKNDDIADGDRPAGAELVAEMGAASRPARLEALVETATAYANAASSENTRDAYAKDWRHFAAWCRREGFEPMPPSSQVIGLYIGACAAGDPKRNTPALSVATIERRLSGLAWNFTQRGTPMDRSDRHIATVLAGIRRKHAKPPRQKEAVLGEDIKAMVDTLGHDLRGLRDRAILLLGFAGGLRRSEIVGLDIVRDDHSDGHGWIEIFPGQGVLLTLRGKTGWREVEVGRGASEQTCPVVALESWIRFGRIARGPLFRRIFKDNKTVDVERLSDKHVARLVKQTALAAGVRADLPEGERAELFAGHSLRAGLASSAEIEERYVQKQLGHASAEMTRKYQRRRDRFRTNLTKASGL
ncbi:tyrosine-type recombinase/integrase [Rhizobium ruizarguesonis]|uniref:tyrosine-type recombinase/integrase n=1 Tax=Rhizobium ruizarguesonis TaxID=2081791 RepID=UPI0010309644|nr:tyrosine-type recombinase/integrase [Rhizobium ruizarguesonis]TAW69513.1 integrase [Rhizobium ruizarguesonis]TAW69993.1 integrase [Rhizobium ruizarguesonis]TAW70115.1 integrase [Rhizobium ruizarguesonis]TAW80868.1 integrase [Rhizobium ruizarguesonis]